MGTNERTATTKDTEDNGSTEYKNLGDTLCQPLKPLRVVFSLRLKVVDMVFGF